MRKIKDEDEFKEEFEDCHLANKLRISLCSILVMISLLVFLISMFNSFDQLSAAKDALQNLGIYEKMRTAYIFELISGIASHIMFFYILSVLSHLDWMTCANNKIIMGDREEEKEKELKNERKKEDKEKPQE